MRASLLPYGCLIVSAWPASAAHAADCPRLGEARGCLRHDLVLNYASGKPALLAGGSAALLSTKLRTRALAASIAL